jgi:hypothetical protein
MQSHSEQLHYIGASIGLCHTADARISFQKTVTMSQPAVPPLVTLPIATIQNDFTTVLSEVHAGIIPSESIWLSCYKDGEPSIHGKVAINLHEHDRDRVELTGVGGVDLMRTSQVRDCSDGHRSFRPKGMRFLNSSDTQLVAQASE